MRARRAAVDCGSDPSWEHANAKLIGYNTSNAAMNMLTVQLTWELRGTNIKVNSATPEFSRIDLNNNQARSLLSSVLSRRPG